MIKKLSAILYTFLCGIIILQAQEELRPLQVNPAYNGESGTMILKDAHTGPLLLPFFDDFSYKGPYPDATRWENRNVFVNSTFAVRPVTVGTATFDALDENGQIYLVASETSYQFAADTLTSRPVRLDSVFSPTPMALTVNNNILLTFYYQPQGTGSAPREKDSLIVEFLKTPGYYSADPENPDNPVWVDDLWEVVWTEQGDNLNSFLELNDSTYFKRVAIPVTDVAYLRSDFKFRFRNYASFPLTKTPDNYAGNISIWNIDYVTLDYGRDAADIYYNDLAFAAPAQSLLKNYHSMPWSHYISSDANRHKSNLHVAITNLSNLTLNYNYRYFVRDENNNIVRNYSGGTWNIAPYDAMGYQTYAAHAAPPVVPNPFGVNLTDAPTRSFDVVHVIRAGDAGDDHPENDTIIFNQVFGNYFSYDDGIPENGYGLIGFNPKGAVRFVLGKPDYLHAVQIYFNPTLNNQTQKPIQVKIWKNLQPEVVLYESPVQLIEYGQGLNEFTTYFLETPLEVSDTIYVGWQQMSNDFLNLGFDATNNASANVFYNTTGEWLPTIYSGAPMIRAVIGQQKLNSPQADDNFQQQVYLYPNPVKHDIVYIQKPSDLTSDFNVIIYDMTGKVAATFSSRTSLDVSELTNGIYFMQLKPQNGSYYTPTRFIIAR